MMSARSAVCNSTAARLCLNTATVHLAAYWSNALAKSDQDDAKCGMRSAVSSERRVSSERHSMRAFSVGMIAASREGASVSQSSQRQVPSTMPNQRRSVGTSSGLKVPLA